MCVEGDDYGKGNELRNKLWSHFKDRKGRQTIIKGLEGRGYLNFGRGNVLVWDKKYYKAQIQQREQQGVWRRS